MKKYLVLLIYNIHWVMRLVIRLYWAPVRIGLRLRFDPPEPWAVRAVKPVWVLMTTVVAALLVYRVIL